VPIGLSMHLPVAGLAVAHATSRSGSQESFDCHQSGLYSF